MGLSKLNQKRINELNKQCAVILARCDRLKSALISIRDAGIFAIEEEQGMPGHSSKETYEDFKVRLEDTAMGLKRFTHSYGLESSGR